MLEFFKSAINLFTPNSGSTLLDLVKKNAKERKYKQAETNYYNSIAFNTSPKGMKNVIDSIMLISSDRRVEPPTYDEGYIPSSREHMDYNTMRIGDVRMVIPPQFIAVSDTSSNDSIVGLRQFDATNIKRGYSRRTISVPLFFNGENQINGFKTPSPFDNEHYYMDGLRSLLAQFKITPFLPVVNEYLNNNYGIFNVALNSVVVSSVNGFPNAFEVTLTMTEIAMGPFIDAPEVMYHDFIDWDLFRFNYQRLIMDNPRLSYKLPKYNSENSARLVIKQLNSEAISGYGKNKDKIYSDENFTTIMDNANENVVMQGLSFQLSNIISTIQLSNHTHPSAQYIGGTSFSFNLTLEVTDEEVIQKLSYMNEETQRLTRDFKEFGTFGFIKIESEAIKMTGTEYFVIDDIQTSTVEGFPGLNLVNIMCTSFNIGQHNREKLVGMTPFENRKGTKDDALSQNNKGLYNSITQAAVIEKKMMEMELYPDLFLPTYKEVDDFVSKNISFRAKNNLSPLPYKKYPRNVFKDKSIRTDAKYVDPDFYVFYPLKYSSMDESVFDLVKGPSNIEPVKTVGRSIDWGDDIPEGFTYDENGNITSIKGVSNGTGGGSSSGSGSTFSGTTDNSLANILIAKCNEGCGYVWGSNGEMYSAQRRKQLEKTFGASHYVGTEKWYGKQVFDCSSFVSWGLRELGLRDKNYRATTITMQSEYKNHKVSKSELKAGDILVNNEHVVVYIGGDKCVEAKGKAYGVVISNANVNRYKNYYRLPEVKSVTPNGSSSNTPPATSNSSSDSSGSQKRAEDFTTVEKLNGFLEGKLKGAGSYYMKSGNKYGINPAFMAAVSMQETGRGKVLNYNNPSGIMDWDNNWKTLRKFPTLEAGIDYSFKNMRNRFLNRNQTTVEDIAKDYAPVGASNDPNGYNKFWPKNVRAFYKQLTGSDNVVTDLGKPGSVGDSSGGDYSSSEIENKYVFKKSENHGAVFGDRVETMVYDDIGSPESFESPVMAVFSYTENTFAMLGKEFLNFVWPFGDVFTEGNYKKLVEDTEINEGKLMNTMYSDMFLYSHKGRVSRMFPSYVFLIADDGGDWLDGRKLWTNFYVYKSVLDISIHQSSQYPVHTAKLSITNVHHNLDSKITSKTGYDMILESDEYWKPIRWIYEKTGALLGSPKLTEEMVDIKNKLYESINLKAGARIHIRMGYGSNPSAMPITFNGSITDVQVGEVVSIVALSQGQELINNVLTADPKEVNGVFNFGSEPSDVISGILTERSSPMWNAVWSKWGESSAYGIESFGMPRGHEELKPEMEYDILKNIYLSNYKMALKIRGTESWIFDKEDNANFYLYNKTPWDAFQHVTQTYPEFICQPLYHQFDSRLFFGLPFWGSRYRYDVGNDGKIYESVKSFAQFHYVDSLSDIIDNQVMASGEGMQTNCVAMYTLGSSTTSSPTVYSDRTIWGNYQKTSVIDTTLEQDYLGPDWLYEKTVSPVAKNAAIKMAISNLIDSWGYVYDGSLILIGDTSIKPNDYLFVNDSYVDMRGLCTVREVVHSLSMDGGLVTTVTPNLISNSTMKNSGQANIIKSLISAGSSIGAIKSSREAMIKAQSSYTPTVSLMRTLAEIKNNNAVAVAVLGALPAYGVGKLTIQYMNSGLMITKFADFSSKVMSASNNVYTAAKNTKLVMGAADKIGDAMKAAKSVKGISTIAKGAKGAKSVLTAIGTTAFPGVGTVVAWVVGTLIFDFILGSIIDEFAYNHSIVLFPMTYKQESFITGVNGQTKLIPGVTDSSEKEIKDEVTERDNERNNSIQ